MKIRKNYLLKKRFFDNRKKLLKIFVKDSYNLEEIFPLIENNSQNPDEYQCILLWLWVHYPRAREHEYFGDNLTIFYMVDCELTKLPKKFENLINLEKIYLSCNNFSELAITSLQNLYVLDLSYNQLTELPEGIENLINLEKLYLSRNKLTGLSEAITKLENLTSLDLSDNQLTELPDEITKLKNLVYLNLRGNKLTELPEGITKLKNLTDLDLSDKQLTYQPEGIEKLINLGYLRVNYNRFSDGYIEKLRRKMPCCRIF